MTQDFLNSRFHDGPLEPVQNKNVGEKSSRFGRRERGSGTDTKAEELGARLSNFSNRDLDKEIEVDFIERGILGSCR